MFRFLSHTLGPSDPVFPGNPRMKIEYQYHHDKGDPFNQFTFQMCNHVGTHIDLPRHFNPQGKTVELIAPEELVFNTPVLLDIPKTDNEMIEGADLAACREQIGEADLLLIRTGFERYRGGADRYATANPYLGQSCAEYLLRELAGVKAVGLDFISAGNSGHIDDAIAVHRMLLGYPEAKNRYVFIIEDVALKDCPRRLRQVIVAPLRIEGADGVPCTIFASD